MIPLFACQAQADYQRKCLRIRLQFAAAVIAFTVITIALEQLVTGAWWIGVANVGIQIVNAAVMVARYRRAYKRLIAQTGGIALVRIMVISREAGDKPD